MAPRPSLPLGSWGEVNCAQTGPSRYKARARFRDNSGTTRQVARYGQTKAEARKRLREALAEEAASVTRIDRTTTIGQLADLWLEEAGGGTPWSAATREAYRWAVDNHVRPRLGQVTAAELRPPIVNQAITAIVAQHGTGAAKTARSALAGIVKYAIRNGAMTSNPVRDAVTVPRKRKVAARALTREQADEVSDRLRSDAIAVRLDLPDVVDWMLGTGCRIGEALAARLTNVARDGDEGVWDIDSTVIRVPQRGLAIQLHPKSAAGARPIALPSHLLAMLDRRASEPRLAPGPVLFTDETGRVWEQDARVVFPSPSRRSLRDTSNTAGALRKALNRIGYDWVSSHTFRRTVATWLDEAGLGGKVSDQLGHANRSMTLDFYIGRKVVSPEAAKILDR